MMKTHTQQVYILLFLFQFVLMGCNLSSTSDEGLSTRLAFDADAQPTLTHSTLTPRLSIISPTLTLEPTCTYLDSEPSPRARHEMVYDSHRQKVVLFGGYDLDFEIPAIVSETSSRHLTETWEYDGCNWQRVLTEQTPPSFDDFDIIYDFSRKIVVLLGQYTPPIPNVSHVDSIMMMWEYDGSNWREVTAVKEFPSPRIFADMAFNSETDQIILFGGMNIYRGGNEWLKETWKFEQNEWVNMTSELTYLEFEPTAEFPLLTFNTEMDVFILLSRSWNSTSIFNGSLWDNLSHLPNMDLNPEMSVNREMNVLLGDMIFDVQREIVVAHGASGTWEYADNQWHRVETSISPNSLAHAMVYDEARGVTILFGGKYENGEPVNGLWIYDGTDWYQE